LLTEVGNGGFGPGYGLVGLPGGISDVDGRSLVELSRMLLLELSASPSSRSASYAIGAAAYGDVLTVRQARFSRSLKTG
jgi:hypothetical protein